MNLHKIRPTRPRGRKACGLCLFLLFLCSGAGRTLTVAPPQGSVILITIDTLRADRLEPYGYEEGKTAAITALARQGVLFENVIVQTPITLPSHASILTGTYPIFHGLQDVVGHLREDVPTLPEWFQKNGYRTAAFVGSSVLAAQWGLDRGFDLYEDSFSVQGLRQIDFSRVERPAGAVLELAKKWVRENSSAPFFLWIHLYDPHDPYVPPEPFAGEFKENPYDGEVAYVDAELGKFFQELKSLNLWEESLVVLTADHGESLGEHKEEHHAYYIYEASLRVPLIFKIPARLAGGRLLTSGRIPGQVRSVDLAPTILQLLGEQVPEWMQGESLAGFLAGKRKGVNLPAYAETHYPRVHFNWSPLFSFSNSSFKFIEAPQPELYDLKMDPGELNNIYSENASLAAQLRQELHELQRRFAVAPDKKGSGNAAEVDQETLERLQSLGYIAFSSGAGEKSDFSALPDPKSKIDTYNELNRAIALSREGRSDQAVSMLKQVAAREPEMPLVHFLLGMEYFQKDLHLLAAEQFSETVKRNPGSDVARFNLARSWAQAGLTEKAMSVTRQILRSQPNHYGARHLLATLFSKTGDFQKAAAEEEKVVQIRPYFAEARSNLGSYYLNLGRPEDALEQYLAALQIAPGDLAARINIALTYLQLKRFDEAEAEARKVVSMSPRAALGYFYLGQAYLGKGLEQEARSAFQKARELNPNLRAYP